MQGVINTDYRLEVVTSGSRQLIDRTQNILLEVRGGSVDWLEVGGVTTPIGPFVASALGFTGRAPNGQPIDDYIIDVSSRQDEDYDYEEFLAKPPVEPVERVYSIDEVKYSARIRDKVRRIDLDTITFETGSAEMAA